MVRKTLLATFLFLILHVIVPGQLPTTSNGDALTLTTECVDREELQLRLRNHTDWPVAVATLSFYYNPMKYRTLKLSNGGKVPALPNDEEIRTLMYDVEKEIRGAKGR